MVAGDGSAPDDTGPRGPARLLLPVGFVAAVVVAAVLVWTGGTRAAAPPPAGGVGLAPHVPQFVVQCAYSHGAPDDPIVFPGRPGASHHHDFFGNATTSADSALASLVGQPTSCRNPDDTAAYWAPTLYDGGVAVTPSGVDAYYRPGPGVDPARVVPYPAGLKMVSGDAAAKGPQPIADVGYSCGAGTPRSASPPVCAADASLSLTVVFPDCWNGRDLDAPDHRAHMARSVDGRCPSGHPVPVPQLTLVVRYPVHGGGHDLRLASGPTTTAHADFWNSWHQPALERDVALCLHRELVCSLVPGVPDTTPQSGPATS